MSRMKTPSRGDQIASGAVEVIGGPTGRHAAIGRRGWSYAVPVLSALASVMVALGVLQKNHCVSNGWSTPGSLWRECYSDLPLAVGSNASQPWATGGPGNTQPVLTALLTWLVRQVVPDGFGPRPQRTYFAIAAVIIALCIAGCVVLLASMLPDTPWLAAHMALSPVLITSALISFDAFGVLLTTGALWAWYRRNPVLTGVLLGAATMARSYPLIVAVAILLVALRDRRARDAVLTSAGLLGSTAVLLGGASLLGDALGPYRTWWHSDASYGSPWMLLQIMHLQIPAEGASWLAVAGWVAAVGVGFALVQRPAYLTPLAPLALTMLVIVMCTGKTMTPQQALWVLPFLALCAFHWREHLIWAGVELVYFAMLWMYVGSSSNPAKALPGGGYAVFLVVRLVTYGALAWVSWESAEELQDVQEPDEVERRELAVSH